MRCRYFVNRWIRAAKLRLRLQSCPQDVPADELDRRLELSSGAKDSGDSCFFECRNVMRGDGAAENDKDVQGVVLFEQRHDAGDDDVVGSGEDAEADAVDVLLNGSV